jgi:hypothetical protein
MIGFALSTYRSFLTQLAIYKLELCHKSKENRLHTDQKRTRICRREFLIRVPPFWVAPLAGSALL